MIYTSHSYTQLFIERHTFHMKLYLTYRLIYRLHRDPRCNLSIYLLYRYIQAITGSIVADLYDNHRTALVFERTVGTPGSGKSK